MRGTTVSPAQQDDICQPWRPDPGEQAGGHPPRFSGVGAAYDAWSFEGSPISLSLARERATRAELRARQLEASMDRLEADPSGQWSDSPTAINPSSDGGPFASDRTVRHPVPDGDDLSGVPLKLVDGLARLYAFADLGTLTAQGVFAGDQKVRAVAALCAFGQRVLDLDAEDFGMPETAGEVPKDLLERALPSRIPQAPRERPRGALASLRPVYSLILEVIAINWRRQDMNALLAAVHIAGQYMPLLAWEPVLGHAGDPALLGSSVSGEGSRFGVPIKPGAERLCDHTRPERSACERVLRVSAEPPPGWRAYFDRQHSQVAQALGDCAARCRTPCSVMLRLDDAVRADLTERCKLAVEFTDGALVRLRHAAPVGSGFGVPSPEEVQTAWARSRASLRHHLLGEAVLDSGNDEDYPLPGLPALFSAIAAGPVVPDTLLRDVTARITELVGQDGQWLR